MAAADRFLQRCPVGAGDAERAEVVRAARLVKMLPRTPPIFMARSRDAASASATEEKTAVIVWFAMFASFLLLVDW